MKKSSKQKFPRDVFFALSHQIRRQIIQNLAEKPTTISNISKESEISMQLLGKHLRILYDTNLVKKQENSEIILTQYGKTVSNQL